MEPGKKWPCLLTTFLRQLTFNNKKAGFTYKYTLTTLRADGKDGESQKGEYNSDIGRLQFRR